MRFRSTFIMTDYFNKLQNVGWKASKYCYLVRLIATSVHFYEYLAKFEHFDRMYECKGGKSSVLDLRRCVWKAP